MLSLFLTSNSSNPLHSPWELFNHSQQRLPMPDSFGNQNVQWLSLLALAAILLVSYRNGGSSPLATFWQSQPFVGRSDKEWFTALRARLRTIFGNTKMTFEGYGKFSKLHKCFALHIFGDKPYLLLPPSLTKEFMGKSDHEVDDRLVHMDQLQSRYTMPPGILENDFHFELVRKQMTRKIPLVTAELADEIQASFEDYWPQSTEWTTVKIHQLSNKIVARSANRIFVGPELCRNEEFLEHSRLYAQGVFTAAVTIKLFPNWLRPLVAPLITSANRKHFDKCLQLCEPIIERRLKEMALNQSGEAMPDYSPPNDFLQWLLDECLSRNDPSLMKPTEITSRLMSLNMVAIHTSSMVMTNLILDLYSSPESTDFVSGLREEVQRVKPEHNDPWTKTKVGQLVRIDSSLRESMRVSDIGDFMCVRLVTAPQGVSFTNGAHVPAGANIAIPSRPIHRDSDYYPSPNRYDAFRFSQPLEKDLQDVSGPNSGSGDSASPPSNPTALSLVTLTDTFLPFGAGKHACPGRLFAANELKMIVGHLVDNYDIEVMDERPKNMEIIGVSLPSESSEIRTRRRVR